MMKEIGLRVGAILKADGDAVYLLRSGHRCPAAIPQPAPTGSGESVTDAVIQDINARREMGRRKYGTELRTNNGREALVDAYQEVLDLACYLKQALMERDS